MLPASLALYLLSLPVPDPPAYRAPWRFVDNERIHVGVRPALEFSRGSRGLGATLQVSVTTPW